MPRIAEIIAIPCATRSRGNSSRMIPKASGKIAPPQPWIDAGDDQHADRVASAASSVPAPRTPSEDTSVRSLPNMSPRRPTIGVRTDALSR